MSVSEAYRDSIRYQINRFIFDKGFAPSSSELAKITGSDQEKVQQALTWLHDCHALVLHPNSFDIWIAHPFALFPTLFWVTVGNRKWWGNCAWCSLGIASLTTEDSTIYTQLEGHDRPITIHIEGGKVLETDYVVHFPKPVRNAWDNVVHFCASTLIFENEAQVDHWCKQHNVKKGRVIAIEQAWELSKRWYGYYLSPDWKPKTAEGANQIFEAVGLTDEYWKLS